MIVISIKVHSISLEGMRGREIIIEANVRTEKEQFVIVGLPDTSMKESKERILSALHTLSLDLSMKKITVNLSPADQRKSGTGFDCAMFLAVYIELTKSPIVLDDKTCVLASLSLDGKLLPFHGLIPSIQQATLLGFQKIIIPSIDISFFRSTENVQLITIDTIQQLLDYLSGQLIFCIPEKQNLTIPTKLIGETDNTIADFQYIRGHEAAKRALEIAAAGRHHVLLSGPPGCGKSMLAEAFHTILPDVTNEEMLEIYSIYHLAKEKRGFSARPPYRSPHHSASSTSLIGGGTYPKPGEISLAHDGVLFLDELGEFSRKALDMLRQPMETGEITINRVRQSITYPASFTLIAATNPCPCGYFGSNERYCTCTTSQVRNYQLKASGPLIDRLDFILSLKSIGIQEANACESSEVIRKRTTKAREMQRIRYDGKYLNGNVPVQQLLQTCGLSNTQIQHIQKICFQKKWSNRAQVKLIRIARTIADLNGDDAISDEVIAEAIQWKEVASELNKQESMVSENG